MYIHCIFIIHCFESVHEYQGHACICTCINIVLIVTVKHTHEKKCLHYVFDSCTLYTQSGD